MSRKNSILIILAATLLIVGGLLFFYFSNIDTTQSTADQTQTTTSPFGGSSPNRPVETTKTGVGASGQGGVSEKNLSQLIQIYKSPSSGSVFSVNKNGQNILKFVDRAVGNIYEYSPESQTGEGVRITNTTIPKIQETVWSNSGNDLVLRYLENDTDNISSFSGKIISGSSTPTELTGLFLPSNIKQLVINPTGNRLFGLVDKSDRSGSLGFISNLDGSGRRTIFDSPISYFNISWPKEDTVAFTTKPNYREPGMLFFFNTQNYSMNKVLGNILGLSTVVNKNINMLAYSYIENSSFYLDVYDIVNKTGSGYKITTLADKCVWGNTNTKVLYCAIPKTIPSGNYPDVWYQGLVSFSDDIWRIDMETGIINQIYEIGSNETVDIDAYELKTSLDDKYLVFTNKTDLSLWLLNINQK